MLLVDLNYNFEFDWFVELSDNKLSDNKLSDHKLSDNNLASELEGGVRARGDAVLRCFWCGFSELFFNLRYCGFPRLCGLR